MTKDEFMEFYATNAGMSVAQLEELGAVPLPCDCEEDSCKGWMMINKEMLAFYQKEDKNNEKQG